MQKRSLKVVAPLAVVSAAVLAVSTGFASASGTSRGGPVRVYEADTNYAGNQGTVVLTGAITATGTDYQGGGPNGTNKLDLGPSDTPGIENTIDLDVSDVGNKLNNLPVDETTCSSDGTVIGRVPIVSGTGAYQGITGTLYVEASAAYVLQGAPGACDTTGAQSGVLIVKGLGTVSYKGNN